MALASVIQEDQQSCPGVLVWAVTALKEISCDYNAFWNPLEKKYWQVHIYIPPVKDLMETLVFCISSLIWNYLYIVYTRLIAVIKWNKYPVCDLQEQIFPYTDIVVVIMIIITVF